MNQPARHEPARRRHLMDPQAPRRAPDPAELERLHRVQRTVISALVFTTMLHLAVGLVIAADHVDDDRVDAQAVLVGLGTACWLLGVAAVLAIQRRRVLSAWLLTGIPFGALGAWWVLLR